MAMAMAAAPDAAPPALLRTGAEVRLAARNKTLTAQTSGLAPTYLQANLIVLPERYADDFRMLCARNPVPCPLLAESALPGAFAALTTHLKPHPKKKLQKQGLANGTAANGLADAPLDIAADIDLRHDFPKYRIYKGGRMIGERDDIEAEWTDSHVGFLIGCSYSFEAALADAGLPPRQVVQGRNVPMYRTTLRLCPAGVFTGSTYVVSMRPYRPADIDKVRAITRPFATTHGEPIAWGWEAVKTLGIEDITRPEWGEESLRLDGSGDAFDEGEEGYVPVFWGCGVTPQNAVMSASLEGTVMAHAPGHMVVLDVQDHHVFPVAESKVGCL